MTFLKYPVTWLTAIGAFFSAVIKFAEIQYDDSVVALVFMVISMGLSLIIGLAEELLLLLNTEIVTNNSFMLAILLGMTVAYVLDIVLKRVIFLIRSRKLPE